MVATFVKRNGPPFPSFPLALDGVRRPRSYAKLNIGFEMLRVTALQIGMR